MTNTNKDQFGYYLVGDYKTYSKMAALERANLVNIPVEWIFNDSVFSTYPWKIDTGVDIKILYKKRAEQIRNKYDYIVIWYSGGVDSFTMLNTFKENNIHVDEIAQFHSYDGEKTWDSFLNKEIEAVAIPQTTEFLKAMPHTKHRIVDLTPIIESIYQEDNNHIDFIYYGNHAFGPHHLARSYLREKIPDYKKIIASGKKLCFVYGSEKPPVRYDMPNDKYYLEFRDIVDSCVGPRTQILDRQEEHDELFYWSPDAMDLMARQGHIIANYMRNPPKEDLDSTYLSRDPFVYLLDLYGSPKALSNKMDRRTATKIGNNLFYLTAQGLNRLVYPDWKENTFTLGKNIGYIFGPRDRWWWQGHRAKDRIMFRTAFESYYDKFTKYGFNGFKLSKKILANPTEVRLDQILGRIGGMNAAPENINNKDTANLKKYIVSKYGSTLSYVDDFTNLHLDPCSSQKYYL